MPIFQIFHRFIDSANVLMVARNGVHSVFRAKALQGFSETVRYGREVFVENIADKQYRVRRHPVDSRTMFSSLELPIMTPDEYPTPPQDVCLQAVCLYC